MSIFLKSGRYYWDIEAVREPQSGNAHSRGTEQGNQMYQEARDSYYGFKSPEVILPAGRNLRSVWEINTQPFKGAHFAVFPEKIPERCILAATSGKGNCSKCGKAWVRVIEKTKVSHEAETDCKNEDAQGNTRRLALMRQAAREQGHEYANETKTLGWKPQCSCEAPAEPALVLDPFSGSGTTGAVAKRLGRGAILIDMSKEYCDMAIKRITATPSPLPLL